MVESVQGASQVNSSGLLDDIDVKEWNELIAKLEDLLGDFRDLMMKYRDNPEKYHDALKQKAEEIQKFFGDNKSKIEEYCKVNHWPASGSGSYLEEIEGAVNSCKAILHILNTPGEIVGYYQLQMLNEDLSGIDYALTHYNGIWG